MKKGVFEFKIGDTERGFKFGTLAMAVAEKEEGRPASVILKSFANEDGQPNLMTILNVFYGAAVNYADSKGQPADFTKSDVSDWLDEIGLTKFVGMLSNGLHQYTPKNSVPLEKTQTGAK